MKQACFYKTKSLHKISNSLCIAKIKTCRLQRHSDSLCWKNYFQALSLVIFFSLSSIAVVQAQTQTPPSNYTTGHGLSSSDPYLISSLDNLYWLAVQVNSGTDFNGVYFKQTTDIDLSSYSAWIPIGTDSYFFTGNYDGNQKIIKNLTQNCSSYSFTGLFGAVSGGSVKNLGVVNFSIAGSNSSGNIGGLIGGAQNSTISNCYTSGSITLSGTSNQNNRIGGLLGEDYGDNTITNCYSKCSFSFTASSSSIGGLVGIKDDASGSINYCYSVSTMNIIEGSVLPSDKNNIVGFCGLINGISGVTIADCYYDQTTSGLNDSGNGIPKTTVQMQTSTPYSGSWTSANWSFVNGSYPKLVWQIPVIQTNAINFTSVTTTGMTIGWTNGDGSRRAVFMKEGTGTITNPSNNTTYTSSTNWSSKETQLGSSGYYCVFNGTGSSVSVSNLALGTLYTVQIFEYNGANGSEKYLTTSATNNPNTQATLNTISSIARSSTATTNASSVSWTVTFAASVTGLTASNFSLANTGLTSPSITGVTGSGTTWTVTASTGSGSGSLGLNLINSTGLASAFANTLPFTGEVYTIDKTAPTISSINRQTPTDETTAASSAVYRVTFSKSVNGVDVSDFTLTKTGATIGTIESVSASTGTAIDVTVNSVSGVGTLRLDLNSSGTGITDNAGNAITGGYTSGQTYTIITPGTWTGNANNSKWTDANNWAGGAVPNSTTNVTIPSSGITYLPMIFSTDNAECNNLNVADGNLEILSSSSGTGSLIVHGTASGRVWSDVFLTGNQWHIVAPPSEGSDIGSFISSGYGISAKDVSGTTTYAIADYNEGSNTWNSYFTENTSGTFASGKGYTMRLDYDSSISFYGPLVTGTKTVSLTTTGQGWNCIGNPYTSAIGMNSSAVSTENFITKNSSNLDASYACVYVWDEDATYTGQNCYKVISNSGFSTTKTILAQNYVAPGQGFFVKAKTGASNISFTSAMQSQQVGTPFRAPAVKTSWPGIALSVASTDASSSAIITFNRNMTNGLDPTYDAGMLRGTNGLSLYTRLLEDNGVDFAIQCLPESYDNLVIPVGVDCKDGGEITFSAETVNLPAACNVILEDRTTNTFTSLADGATYNTTVQAGSTAVGRFYIHTGDNTTTGISGLTAEIFSLKAYAVKGSIIIEGEVSDQAIATLYDLQGLKVLAHSLQKGSLNTLSCPDLMNGIYLLTIQQDGETVTKKLILK